MAETKTIIMKKTSSQWLDLVLHLNNSVAHTFRIACEDLDTAKKYAHRLADIVSKHTQFPLVVFRRGCDVYVVKTYFAQKVVIRDE